jgi:dUTPase
MTLKLACKFSIDFPKDTDKSLPSKQKEADEGYDVSFVKILEEDEHFITLDSCLSVQLQEGYEDSFPTKHISKDYYIDLVPRSSLPKSKLILANSFGVIDKEYTGTLKAKFFKCPGYSPIALPARLLQIIIRKSNSADRVFETDSLIDTHRGDKGFGSSGV